MHPADPMITRRSLLEGAALVGGALLLPRGFARADHHELPEAAGAALAESRLVYISPLKADGSESRCHGEVWFVRDGAHVLVVTNPERWRAAAVSKGLDRARLWVGDYGVWTKAEGRYREAPSYVAKAELLRGDESANAALVDKTLARFGEKYSEEWGKWGPRFRDGLASGGRILLRYSPLAS